MIGNPADFYTDEEPLVSIIIPCFNYAQFLPAAIESALRQTYHHCEVIVIDDGSTDGTSQVGQSYGGAVRYIYQQNSGLSAARNAGINMARGEFLVFLDADDILKPEMVGVSMDAMNRLGTGFAVVANIASLIDENGEELRVSRIFPQRDTEISALDLVIRNRFPVTALVRKEIFERCGLFDEQLPASEDRDMWVRAASEFRIMRLGATLLLVRRHGRNMSDDGSAQADSIKRVQEKALSGNVVRGWRNIYRLKIKAYYLYQKGMMASTMDPSRAIFRIVSSILLWPVFSGLESLGERRWFRIRMMGWILAQWLKKTE